MTLMNTNNGRNGKWRFLTAKNRKFDLMEPRMNANTREYLILLKDD